MGVGIKTLRGALPLVKRSKKGKAVVDHYLGYVLESISGAYVPPLYTGGQYKVGMQYTKGLQYMTRKTCQYSLMMKVTERITIINTKVIPGRACDCSPMNFFELGYSKI